MYSIADISEMTGLTDRTLRNYLAAGFLQGEKLEGRWQFTAEQFVAFLRNEAVKPALEAKRNSRVFDFLADTKKPQNAACVLLDLRGEDTDALSDFFCEAANRHESLHMSFHREGSHSRVILTGREEDVLETLGAYREKFKS